jgi:glycosyltransferase involved in cell wall biosynthesis
MRLNDIAVYIPAFNAAVTLPQVFARMPKNLKSFAGVVLVVDNASDDLTSEVARTLARKQRIKNFVLIKNKKNIGYGGSQKVGYQYVINRGFSWVIMIHGDAQYSPGHALMLLERASEGDFDLLFGSRINGNPLAGGMPLHRFIGNRVLTKIQNILLKTKISEFHSGYRVYKISSLRKINISSLSSDYHFDTEIMICMINRKMRIGEVPIPTKYGSEKNYVNIWKYGIAVLVSTFTYFLHSRNIRNSLKWRKRLGHYII